MTDPTVIISSARLGWQILARLPWLFGWLLRRSFPVHKCKTLFSVSVPGNHIVFELLVARPSHALCGLELKIINQLPFAVEIEAYRLTGSINSTNVFDFIMNNQHVIPAFGNVSFQLPEMALTAQQTSWIKNNTSEHCRLNLDVFLHCRSSIHSWDMSVHDDCNARVNCSS